ncbi:MAG: hypothetical protein KAH17_04005 [Bacteroidales bacterium]|nr:hypothetical protein [Bacteroidales bacterium]
MRISRVIVHPITFLLLFGLIIISDSYSQSQNQINLSGKWKVTWNDGTHGPNYIDQFCRINPSIDSLRYLDVDVPMDLNIAMQKKGIVGDLNFGANYLSARWIAEQYWQYFKQFDVPAEALNKTSLLTFDRLDYLAKIYLNGEFVGSHENAFIPCTIDVTGKLKEGKNTLSIGIASGLYDVADENISDYNGALNRHLNKRHW